MISFVAAMSRGRVIGNKGKLPWGRTMDDDRQRYFALITGKPIVMGSGTYHTDSQENQLAERVYVLTSRDIELSEHAEIIRDTDAVLALAESEGEVIVAGGGKVFAELMPHADKLYLTYIDTDLPGDTHFPEFDEKKWRMVEDAAHPADQNNAYDYRFVTLVRK